MKFRWPWYVVLSLAPVGAGAAELDGAALSVAWGVPFIANPDLPHRLAHKLPLSQVRDPATLFGGSATGYTDYPTLPLS